MFPLEIKYKAIVHYKYFLQSLRRVARLYNISKSTLSRWLKQENIKQSKPKKTINITDVDKYLLEIASSGQHCTLKSIAKMLHEKFQIKKSVSTIFRLLKKNKITRKSIKTKIISNSKSFTEYNFNTLKTCLQDVNTISIDETCFYITERPKYGYSLRGTKIERHIGSRTLCPHRKINLLLAINQNKIVGWKLSEKHFTKESFKEFIENGIDKNVPNNSTLLMDNVPFHKSSIVKEAIKKRGFNTLFIPSYSPQYNPIEMVFAWLKTKVRHDEWTSYSELQNLIGKLIETDISQKLRFHEFFKHCVKNINT